MSKIIDISTHIQASLGELHPYFSKYTYPLFSKTEKGTPDLFASCVFLDIDDSPYLVTAAHALFEIEKSEGDIHVGSKSIKEIQSSEVRTSNNGKDPLDLAVMKLTDDFINDKSVKILSTSNTTIGRHFNSPQMYCMHGFPCSKNIRKKAINMEKKIFSTYAFTYGATDIEDKYYAICKKDKKTHIGLSYKISRDSKGNKVNPYIPKGMSGGGCWLVPDILNTERVYLSGILIENPGKHVYATRIENVYDLVQKIA